MNYSKEDFKALFQAKFDYNKWFALLKDFFKADELRTTAEAISDPADCDKGYYIGAINTSDSYRIGLFYYEIGHSNVARKKVGLRNLVRTFINPNWGQFDAALAVFSDGEHWRLSLVSDIKGEATAAKRFTFVFGEKDNLYRTALERFALIRAEGPSFEVLKKAFSVEALTEEFFGLYKEHYERFCDFIYQNANDSRYFGPEFAQWNSQEDTRKFIRDYVKNLMGRIVFLQFLQKKGWMGVPTDRDDWTGGDPYFMQHLYDYATEEQKEDFLDKVLEPLFFNCLNILRPGDVFDTNIKGIGTVKVPYLNGELFEQKEVDKAQSRFPKKYFHDLLNLFLQYNFTIDENDPNDAEIGVDPEMLGKIFENLLEDNKDKGAFYTPKEIVRYMCKESLIAYLCSNNGVKHADSIKVLVNNHQLTSKLQEDIKTCERLNKHLRNVKVCDPAIGSGAFPMGLMNEIFACRSVLHENIEDTDEKTSGHIKREIIQNNIYGVDIEQGAVDIARLRFWLALVVDSVKPEPLPNLDYKIMQGNSLIESYKGLDLSSLLQSEDLFVATRAEELEKHLKSYFRATDNEEKRKLRAQIDFTVKQCINAAGIQETIELPNTDFFLWHTYFHDVFKEGGFDIVIGNPPYVNIQQIPEEQKKCYQKQFACFVKRSDLFSAFIEHALMMLSSSKGGVSFIVPSVVHSNLSFQKLRNLFLDNHWLAEVCYTGGKVFHGPTVDTTILRLCKAKVDDVVIKNALDFSNPQAYSVKASSFKNQNNIISITDKTTVTLFDKLFNPHYVSLDSLVKVFQGIVTGNNPAFIFDSEEDALNNGIDKELLHPLCHGRDIEKYAVRSRKRRILYLNNDIDISRYPRTGAWLIQFKDKLETRREAKKGVITWYSLQWPRAKSELDIREKILVQNTRNESLKVRICATLDDMGVYASQGINFLIPKSKNVSLRLILGLLNSKLMNYLFSTKYLNLVIKAEYLKQLRIPCTENAKIASLVDNILAAKRLDPSADISANEQEIDRLVYHLYGLTYNEIIIVDPVTSITEEEYNKA